MNIKCLQLCMFMRDPSPRLPSLPSCNILRLSDNESLKIVVRCMRSGWHGVFDRQHHTVHAAYRGFRPCWLLFQPPRYTVPPLHAATQIVQRILVPALTLTVSMNYMQKREGGGGETTQRGGRVAHATA